MKDMKRTPNYADLFVAWSTFLLCCMFYPWACGCKKCNKKEKEEA